MSELQPETYAWPSLMHLAIISVKKRSLTYYCSLEVDAIQLQQVDEIQQQVTEY
jgi:hypothetical protein